MTKWQKQWYHLSSLSKAKLKKYGHASPSNIKKMRSHMFLPVWGKRQQKKKDHLQALIYKNAIQTDASIIVKNSKTHPQSVKVEKKPAYIHLPKDPIKEAIRSNYALSGISEYPGFYSMAVLAHERSEQFIMNEKWGRRGSRFKKHLDIGDGTCHHSSVHPLIAEANLCGQSIEMLAAMKYEWSPTPGQSQVYPLLKEFGWTPGYGLPMYGKISFKLQKRAETMFKPFFQEMIRTEIYKLERRFKGHALRSKKKAFLEEASIYAGGKGLKKKYL